MPTDQNLDRYDVEAEDAKGCTLGLLLIIFFIASAVALLIYLKP